MPFAKRNVTDRKHREPWTEEEVIRAIDMKDRLKLTWPVIAARMGRSPESLAVHASQYRKGRLKFSWQKSRAIYEEIAEALIDGAELKDCVVRFGIKRRTIIMGLTSRGWDRETIAEARDEKLAA